MMGSRGGQGPKQLPLVLDLPAQKGHPLKGEGVHLHQGTLHGGNAYLDDKPRGHGGQVLLQSQLEIFINLICNPERQEKGLSHFLGRWREVCM